MSETVIAPDLPIIDPHHHLWDGRRSSEDPPVHGFNRVIAMTPRYLMDEIAADVASGHNIIGTVFVECRAMYREAGDPDFATVGETEFVNGIAAMSASGAYGPCRMGAGIVGRVDLRIGDKAGAVLESHMAHAPERFRGIRNTGAWDADEALLGPLAGRSPEGLYLDADFRRGFAHLGRLGLSFDAWVLEPGLPDVIDLARAFPDTSIILDHVGTPLNLGVYEGRLGERYDVWRDNMRALAKSENVTVKLGGLAMAYCNLDGFLSEPPASSERLAKAWRPYIEPVIEAFGPERCMFESNFPVDRGACDYATLWNALKRTAAGASEGEKDALFRGTAARVYKLDL